MWEWLSWDGLGHVADALSLVTAFVSGYAALKVRKIGARLAFNVRADDVLNRLDAHADWMERRLISGSYDQHQMLHRIVQCRAEMEAARAAVDGEAAIAMRRLVKLHRRYEKVARIPSLEAEEATGHFWGILNEIRSFSIHTRGIVGGRRIGSGG